MDAKPTIKQSAAAWSGRPRGFVADRIVVALLLLCIALLAAGVFLAALGLISPSRLMPGWGKDIEQVIFLPQLPHGLGRLVAGSTAAVVGLVAVMLLLRRILPGAARGATQHHILSADDHGLVLVDKKGICTVAEAAVQKVGGVVDVKVRVLGQGTSAVRLVVQTWVHAGAELRRVGEEGAEKAREAVEQLVGLDVYDVVVRIHVVPLEALDRVVE